MILEPMELAEVYRPRGRMAAFAKAHQVDYSYITAIMRGVHLNPTYETLRKLTQYAVEQGYCHVENSFDVL